jgi:RIO kinase 1
MEYIGSEDIDAPLLKDVRLEPQEAVIAFERIVEMLDGMLSAGIVHGNLSAFNILYTRTEPVLIDFPQSIRVSSHDEARTLFSRDVGNICRFFLKYGMDTPSSEVADELWTRYYRF